MLSTSIGINVGPGKGYVMAKRSILVAMTTCVMLAAPCVSAQQTPNVKSGVAGDPIVVEGQSITNDQAVRALTRAISPRARPSRGMARFTDPVCFAAVGLPAPMLRTIGYRLADDAVAAGLRLAGDRCDPNIVVLFVDDAQAELESMLKRQPTLFRTKQPSEIRAIMDDPGPVRVWNISEVRGGDGDRTYQTVNGPPRLNIYTASRIRLTVREDLLSTVILIDRKAVVGHSLHQIADYAAFRTLAVIRPKGATGGETILTLFDEPATAPAEMTAFDRNYLKALYEGPGTQRGASKVAMIADRIIESGKGPALVRDERQVP